MNKPAAIYARVSSDRQKESHTIGSQTSALVEYAQTHGYAVPSEWVFQDEGYSGASLVRPGLEALRDLAAQGQIVAVLIYSPDRLSRKYAYQVLLSEELSRCGVEVIYLKSPSGDSPEDQLVVQFQGMIAEYERAQIAERHRRGKRHRAQQGMVNVLSGAPYAGNDQRCGECCATRPTKARRATAKPNSQNGSASRGHCVSGTVPLIEATVIGIGLARTGSNCPFLRW